MTTYHGLTISCHVQKKHSSKVSQTFSLTANARLDVLHSSTPKANTEKTWKKIPIYQVNVHCSTSLYGYSSFHLYTFGIENI